MRAAIQTTFGTPDVLTLDEVPAPTPGPGQVRVEVHASSVTRGDLRVRACDFPGLGWLPGRLIFGFRTPRNPVGGMHFAGRVVELGADVTRFAVGDAVFGVVDAGAYAEAVVIDAAGPVAPLPDGTSYAEAAAATYGMATAVTFLRDLGQVRPGQRVLIVGAAGGVGRHAVQLARHLGAEVTAVCAGRDADRIRALGADAVIDYTTTDWHADGPRYDVIFDTSDTVTFGRAKRALKVGGRFLTVRLSLGVLGWMLWTGLFGGRKATFGVAMPGRAMVDDVAALLECGAVRATIAHRHPFERIVDAHAAAEASPEGDVIVEMRSAVELRRAA